MIGSNSSVGIIRVSKADGYPPLGYMDFDSIYATRYVIVDEDYRKGTTTLVKLAEVGTSQHAGGSMSAMT